MFQLCLAGITVIGAVLLLRSGDAFLNAAGDALPVDEARDVQSLVFTLAGVMGLTAVLGFFGGVGLLTNARWGRSISLVYCAVSLLQFPMGTAVGVYGLIVLTRNSRSHPSSSLSS